MSYRIALFFVVIFSCISSALAQSRFEGFYTQLGTGYEKNTVSGVGSSISIDGGGANFPVGSVSAPNQNFGGMPLVAGIGYTKSITSKWLIGIGGDFSLLSQESSSINFSPSDGLLAAGDVGFGGSKIKTSNRFNVFVMPSYEIDKDKLIYVKAGYSSVKVDVSAPNTTTVGNIQSPIEGTIGRSKTISGYIGGLGYKQFITGGFYGFAEANYLAYNSANFGATNSTAGFFNITTNTNSRLSTYQLLIGLGYKF
jgi:outer membrane immunogenic protein